MSNKYKHHGVKQKTESRDTWRLNYPLQRQRQTVTNLTSLEHRQIQNQDVYNRQTHA